MKQLGFKRLISDAGLFICRRKAQIIIAVVYVDDAIFTGNNKKFLNEIKALFMKKWECHDLGEVKEFLRMRVERHGQTIKLDQRDYLKKVLERFSMINAKPAPTPLPTG